MILRPFDNTQARRSIIVKKELQSRNIELQNTELLFEKAYKEQTIECFEINDYKAFFKTEGDFPFDIFAASFYLLSRYEEYLPHKKDMYGRYAHENSLAFREGFLQLPLINIWIEDFKNCLQLKFPSLTTHLPIAIGTPFTFLPTYDIDEAYSYKYKQWWRTMGGLLKSIVNGRMVKWLLKDGKFCWETGKILLIRLTGWTSYISNSIFDQFISFLSPTKRVSMIRIFHRQRDQ